MRKYKKMLAQMHNLLKAKIMLSDFFCLTSNQKPKKYPVHNDIKHRKSLLLRSWSPVALLLEKWFISCQDIW